MAYEGIYSYCHSFEGLHTFTRHAFASSQEVFG
jgi:hypothetical protein